MNKTQKKKKRRHPSGSSCPYCGGTVILRSADGIYRDNSRRTMLYVCSRYPRCDAYVRTYPGTTKPMGTLANGKLRALRNEAHKYFDQLYKDGQMTRQDAYKWLADLLCVPQSEAHIGYVGEYYCGRIIAESKKLLARRKALHPYPLKEVTAS